MSVTIEACRTVDDILPAISPVWHYFGRTPDAQDMTRFHPFVEPSRAFAAREDGAVVAGCASFAFGLTVPGGRAVPTAGLSVVGVLPTHRRRGILRRMMRAQLDDVRRRGEPLAALWASEDTIYGQFGYGLASVSGDIDLPRAAAAFARPFTPRCEFRILSEADALAPLKEAYDRARPGHPGMIDRSAEWWRTRRLADPEKWRHGAGELNRVAAYLDGQPVGHALYRINQKFEAGRTVGFLQVVEAVGATPEATRDVWRFLFDIDWVERIKANLLPIDHPLFFLLARPREMQFHVHDGLWVRLLDIPAALAARTLGDGEPVVIELTDPFCEDNAGRWRLSPQGMERTTADADLACDVTALGSVYLGGFRLAQLARAGRVTELRAGALARADALLPSDRAPWCPEIF